jgi:MSHA biogenesis protein MshJ
VRKRVRELMAWMDARHPRERAFLLVALIAVLYASWDLVLMAPIREKGAIIEAKTEEVEGEIQKLKDRGDEILRVSSIDPNLELRSRSEELRRQIEGLDARIREYTVTLIPPKEMARFLEELLSERTELRLVRLENLAPEPMLDLPSPDSGESTPGLFKHGFEIELRGGYLSTLDYVRALEGLPWNFFWEDLEYRVENYPEGEATIRAYTVSSEEDWVGV